MTASLAIKHIFIILAATDSVLVGSLPTSLICGPL